MKDEHGKAGEEAQHIKLRPIERFDLSRELLLNTCGGHLTCGILSPSVITELLEQLLSYCGIQFFMGRFQVLPAAEKVGEAPMAC